MTLIVGNWKMNGLSADAIALANDLRGLVDVGSHKATIAVCPPATLISTVAAILENSKIAVGGQDCHTAENGAHTGDIAAPMLKDLGCSYVILGHSERRANYEESDALVQEKVIAANGSGLISIVCVGETLEQRESGNAFATVAAQLEGSLPNDINAIVIAYEPVWAIGTGKVATPDQVDSMHNDIRTWLKSNRPAIALCDILYGGSVKPENAKELLALENVNGALVGGASLKADSFYGIVEAE